VPLSLSMPLPAPVSTLGSILSSVLRRVLSSAELGWGRCTLYPISRFTDTVVHIELTQGLVRRLDMLNLCRRIQAVRDGVQPLFHVPLQYPVGLKGRVRSLPRRSQLK
jgi:hypothetical protein